MIKDVEVVKNFSFEKNKFFLVILKYDEWHEWQLLTKTAHPHHFLFPHSTHSLHSASYHWCKKWNFILNYTDVFKKVSTNILKYLFYSTHVHNYLNRFYYWKGHKHHHQLVPSTCQLFLFTINNFTLFRRFNARNVLQVFILRSVQRAMN